MKHILCWLFGHTTLHSENEIQCGKLHAVAQHCMRCGTIIHRYYI